jgi:hypothetical protein
VADLLTPDVAHGEVVVVLLEDVDEAFVPLALATHVDPLPHEPHATHRRAAPTLVS